MSVTYPHSTFLGYQKQCSDFKSAKECHVLDFLSIGGVVNHCIITLVFMQCYVITANYKPVLID